MKKFLLLYASYSEIDYELFVDCLGVYDTIEQAEQAEVQSRKEDNDDMERVYSIKEITIK